MNGQGIYKWVDGRFYHGEYLQDKKQGFGVYKWADNRCYLGQWEHGKQHGEGHYILPNGTVKKVTFENGTRVSMVDEEKDKTDALSKKLQMI
jgi:hypothetical protein